MQMTRLIALFLGVFCCLAAAEGGAATRPANDPAEIRRMLKLLGSSEAARRQEARETLMSLKRTDLPALREGVKQSLPLEPSQRALLKDIVTQIYLAGDSVMADDTGFLGVRLPNWGEAGERGLLSLKRGVVVVSRIPGFCAYRMFQDGDVLLSITANPDIELNSPDQLIDAVTSAKAGQKLTFEVLRDGQIIKVPIVLDRKPVGLGARSINEFMSDRADRAEELWQREFEPLLAEKVG